MKNYQSELKRAMDWLATKPDTFFLGQSICSGGTAMYSTTKDIRPEIKVEFPVTEALQMGVTLGHALNGTIPISIFPRFDFMILATSELVNHINRIKDYSGGEFVPKTIIRTAIGSSWPLDPQAQHKNDYTEAYKLMLNNFEVIRLDKTEEIFPAYEKAYNRLDGKSTLIVEWADAYDEKWELPNVK